MGYGAGREIKLNMKDWLYVRYNGKNLVAFDYLENIESWDCLHPVDGQSGIRPDVFDYEIKVESLNQEDRDWMKNDGWKKGDEYTADVEKKPEGSIWSGYVSSPLKDTFPVTLEGEIYILGLGYKKIYVTMKPKDWEQLQNLFDDMRNVYDDNEQDDFDFTWKK